MKENVDLKNLFKSTSKDTKEDLDESVIMDVGQKNYKRLARPV